MPEPPDVPLFTRYVFENPWPLMLLLGVAGLVVAWAGLRDARRNLQLVGVTFLILGGLTYVLGRMVTTPGEHAKATVRTMVDAATSKDVQGALAMLTDDAVLSVGSVNNPGVDISRIDAALTRLANTYTIDGNFYRTLNGYRTSDTTATVHMILITEVSGYSRTPSQWVLEVRKTPDGEWKISRIVCIEIANQKPNIRMLW